MNTELKKLFEFQKVIIEMQERIVQFRIKKLNTDDMERRVDKLIEIYKHFDKYYYDNHFKAEKILQLEDDKLQMSKRIQELEAENRKLLSTLEFNESK